MSFRFVTILKSSPTFDLKELVSQSINSALEFYSSSCNLRHEKVEELTELILFVVETMLSAPECIRPSDLMQVVDNLCYGLLQDIQEKDCRRSHNDRLVQSVYKLFAAVLQASLSSVNERLKFRIQEQCLDSLRHYSEEQRLLIRLNMVDQDIEDKSIHRVVLSVKDSLGILDNWFSLLPAVDEAASEILSNPWVENCFQVFLGLLEFGESAVCSYVSGVLLPKLLRLSGSMLEGCLVTVWRRLLDVFCSCSNPTSLKTSNVYISLCGLSEFYIPVDFTTLSTSGKSAEILFQSSRLLTSGTFWQVIQTGLVHTDPLARKQACFLMKRSVEIISAKNVDMQTTLSPCLIASSKQDASMSTKPKESMESSTFQTKAPLFWWSAASQDKLLAIWRDFFLMYETLDETQVHIVTPVMPRLRSLIQSASISPTEGTGRLHTSWLTVLLSRSFVHETKTVLQWGVLQYLQLDLRICPVLQQAGTDYFLAIVLPVLNDDNLYADLPSDSLSSMPPVAAALRQFMTNCVHTLEADRIKVFLRDFLRAVSDQSWSPISLTFVFDMLANLPECNAWGPTELKLLREMQFSCVNMLSLSYRSIVQCLMVQAVLRLLDKDGTSLQQLSNLLVLFGKCLRRGNPLWKQVCDWLKTSKHTNLFGPNSDMVSVIHSEVVTLMTFDSADLFSSASGELADIAEANRVACLVLLATDIDSENAQSSPSSESFLHSVLEPIRSVLERIGSHIYLPIIRADTALQLLHSLLQHLNQSCPNKDHKVDNVGEKMISILATTSEEIFAFIAKRLISPELAEVSDVRRVSFYISVVESIWDFSSKSCRSPVLRGLLINEHTRLMQCWRMLATQSTDGNQYLLFRKFVATRLGLWFIKMTNSGELVLLPWDTLLSLITIDEDTGVSESNIEAGASINLRKLSNCLLLTQWECLSKILQGSTDTRLFTGSLSSSVLLSACVRDLGLVKACDAVPIIQAASLLVNMVDDGTASSVIVDVVETVWSTIQDEWRGKARNFWHVYTAVVLLICQQKLLIAECGTSIHAAVDKVIQRILTLGEAKPRIVTIFLHHLCRQWANQLEDKAALASTLLACSNHQRSMVDLWIGGTKVRRGARIEQEMSAYLIDLPYLQAIRDDIALCTEQRVGQRRVILLNFLLLVATKNKPECHQFITTFAHAALQKFDKLGAAGRPGYSMLNTQQHRQKVRIWQLLLVLAPYLGQDSPSRILEEVLSSMVQEKQPSVRYLMSLFAVHLTTLQPSLEEIIWRRVQKTMRDDTECSVCPLLILLTHLGMVQHDRNLKEVFYRRAFPVILPWTLVQTSSTRHISLLCAKKAWQDCNREDLGSVLESFPILKACMEFVHSGNSPAQSSQHRVDSYFFLFKFHPVRDYTIQTIFHVLPALTSMAEDEFLEAELFEKDCLLLWDKSSENQPMIGLYNSADSMIQEEFRMRQTIQQESTKANFGVSPVKSALADNQSNVQKKIIPWQDTIKPGFEDVMGLAGPEAPRPSRNGGSLVLVASLIDKAPNLGGLCRTSQIFGVSTLVISNLKILADKTFQSLSVTAEKWLPIIEVTVSDLPAYLQALRHRGYTLVGVEQTARSRCLTEYQFPERTLLLLGHERTGIPVKLIQLLDVCVEIPQQGVVRSLNVHVSGALLMWEYTRQRLLTQKCVE